jgi:holo-[acyl-carrier protein] synthase
MRYTAGCDIVEVARIKKAAENEKFCRRAFSDEEIVRFEKMKSPYESMAGTWAAKEAFAKSLGTGVRGFSLSEITVAHDTLGAPFFKFSGNAARLAEGLEFSVSISHTADFAQAFCIAQRKEND